MSDTSQIYLLVIKKIPREDIEIIGSRYYCAPGSPIKYTGAKGVTYGHIADIIPTAEGSRLHQWLKAAAGDSVSIHPVLP